MQRVAQRRSPVPKVTQTALAEQHVAPHACSVAQHDPATHVWPDAHVPAGYAGLQACCEDGTTQSPDMHDSPVAHGRSHTPQWRMSLDVSMHAEPHIRLGAAHEVWQAPSTHAPLIGHEIPQPPQLLGSEDVLTQTPPQAMRPVGQVVRPPLQPPPAPPEPSLQLISAAHTTNSTIADLPARIGISLPGRRSTTTGRLSDPRWR